MSDVEKAISGLIEDEVLLQQQQQQHQQQQQQATPTIKVSANNYNLKNETGNSFKQQQQQQQLAQHHHQKQQQQQQLQYHHQQQEHHQQHQQQHHHNHQQQQQYYITDSKYPGGVPNSNKTSSSSNNINVSANKTNNCLSRILKLIFSTPGLVVMVIVYTIMGALVFPLLEAPQDISKSAIIAKSREECLKELWIITEKLNVLYERNWTMLVHEQLRRFEGTIVAATRNMANGAAAAAASSSSHGASLSSSGIGGAAGSANAAGMVSDASSTTALGRFGGGGNSFMEGNDFAATKWSFSEALLYSVTVITTIGHGSLTPRTTGGKIATIFYALIGVPLMLMCLSSLGAILAEALQCTYARLCCRWPQYIPDNMDVAGDADTGVDGNVSDDILDDGDDDEDVDGMIQKPHRKRQHRRLSGGGGHGKASKNATGDHQHGCDFQNHKHGINCKYDDIIGDTNTNNIYDYKCSKNDSNMTAATTSATIVPNACSSPTAAATKHGYKEGKLNHQQQQLNSCMQLKLPSGLTTMTTGGGGTAIVGATSPALSTIAVAAQQQHPQQLHHPHQQQQLSQQQYYQQRPDVMLMTTGHKLSSPVQMTTATACRMVLPNTSSSSSAAGTAAGLTALAPPRYYSPPMATYHIVSSASANSSPTHQQAIRHYIIPPSQMPSSAGTHHFMAVPSNLLRFQAAAAHCGSTGTTTSNLSINPLASGSTTTVYFPIVTPAVPQQNPLALSGSTTSNAASVAATNNTMLGTSSSLASSTLQPLVKYHTIQMPHRRRQSLTLHTSEPGDGQRNEDDEVLPPPPPAYQTATVHGIRRAKFLTKPLPQEINTLLHESDISCRHDLSQSTGYTNGAEQQLQQQQQHQQQMVSATPSVTMASTSNSVMMSTDLGMTQQKQQQHQQQSINNLYSNTSSICATTSAAAGATSSSALTNNNIGVCETRESTSPLTHMSSQNSSSQTTADLGMATAAPVAGAAIAAVVDIMEDEEEMEQQRLGNCPHGTPSRVPLLTCSTATSTQEDKSATRSFLHATAASFQRHTSFQRTNNNASTSSQRQRKSMIINRKGECNLHIPTKRRNSAICYRDHMDTSEDDEFMMEENMYKLKHLHQQPQTDKHLHCSNVHDEFDNNSMVSFGGSSTSDLPQVPMLVVLIILVFYVCIGTVIFALWENWSLIDGAYFCFVTLTTIGYGDFVPLRTFQGPEIQLFACCAYLLLGLVLVAMAFSILETQLIWKCKRLAVRLKLTKE